MSPVICRGVVFLVGGLFLAIVSAEYKLTLLHTGDVRCHFEEFNGEDEECTTEDKARKECFGGWARLDNIVKGYREIMDNLLLLDCGNQFHGTLWFAAYKDRATSYFMNRTGYDAMGLGQHEFNLKPSGLVPFLQDADFPVLSCNIDDSQEPIMQDEYKKSTILTVGGQRIGIIGFTYWDTSEITDAGKLKFLDEVDSLKTEAQRLAGLGVNKIVALGRSVFDIHMKIAKDVPGIDIVISGDLNTFLYTGTPPSNEVPTHTYPVVVQLNHDTFTNVLLVQAHGFGKYVGHLEVTFDDDGNLLEWDGNPILLDGNVEEDPETLEEIQEWAKKVDDLEQMHVGITNVLLEGVGLYGLDKNSPCSRNECSIGNLITDAYVQQHIKVPTEEHWNDVAIAMINAGGIKNTLKIGDIDRGDILKLLPYLSTIDTLDLQGEYLLKALEHSVLGYNISNEDNKSYPATKFLQFSGIKVVYDVSKPDGQRVSNVSVLCNDCLIPEYKPLDHEKNYRLLTTSFLASGGDNYNMIADHKFNHEIGLLDTDILEEYIRKMSPLHHGQSGRIRFTHDKGLPCAYGAAASQHLSIHVVMLTTLLGFSLNCKHFFEFVQIQQI